MAATGLVSRILKESHGIFLCWKFDDNNSVRLPETRERIDDAKHDLSMWLAAHEIVKGELLAQQLVCCVSCHDQSVYEASAKSCSIYIAS